ncbi:MAG: hypothetical protein Q8L14_42735 [Myxococcales bacterium]|nr:hypothetical protein [Myxococcales bacterium]
MPTEMLSQYQHGYDGVLEELTLRLHPDESKLKAHVVMRVVRAIEGVEQWFRVRVQFSDVEKVQLADAWLRGGGAVLYDGAKLDWDVATRRASLNLDPGVAWAVGQPEKPELESSAFLSGVCEVAVEPMASLNR